MIEKTYKHDEPQYFCWWEDTCGVYTRQELDEQFADTNLYDDMSGIMWVGYGSGEMFTHFDEVLDFLQDDDEIQNTKFVCDNMSIIRVL